MADLSYSFFSMTSLQKIELDCDGWNNALLPKTLPLSCLSYVWLKKNYNGEQMASFSNQGRSLELYRKEALMIHLKNFL